jgi:hypothetical protein
MLALAVMVVAASVVVSAQERVANYSTGRLGSAAFEHFSFGVRDGQRAAIEYTYGPRWKEITLEYAGAETWKGEKAFKVRFPNGRELYVIPRGETLRVVDVSGKYSKLFRWQYEGPVNGRGTFCDSCAEDETEAMRLMRAHYLN